MMPFSKETLEKLAKVIGWYEDTHPEILQDFRERTNRVMGYMDSLNNALEIDCSEQTKTKEGE